MRLDPLKQFAKLQQQLVAEKAELETRLAEINQVLGSQSSSPAPSPASSEETAAPKARRGRRPRGKMSARDYITKALQERGPLSRGELGEAVRALGYTTKAKDPLGSLGIVLYAKNSPFKKKDGKFYLPGGQAPAKASENNGNGEPEQKPRKKRKLSPEGRARIAAAAKARWAKQKAGK